jgi:hypothetical protein
MTEWTAHCGCKITMDDADGEPVEFVQRCVQHPAPATVTDVSGENRAMSLARKALEDSGVDPETITSEVDPETRIGRARGPAGEIAEAPKLSLAEYLDAHPHAAERFAKKG